MKKYFISEVFRHPIIQAILTGVVVFLLQNYIQNKWTPLTAAETLKKENFLNSKRDTYFQAIDILNRNLANSEFTVNGIISDTTNRKRGGTYPTEVEVNSCYSKLCIYSDDKNIPLTFKKIFVSDKPISSVLEMSTFIKLLRKDLGYGDIPQDSYEYIILQRKNG